MIEDQVAETHPEIVPLARAEWTQFAKQLGWALLLTGKRCVFIAGFATGVLAQRNKPRAFEAMKEAIRGGKAFHHGSAKAGRLQEARHLRGERGSR